MNEQSSHYKRLEVSEHGTQEEIRNAYRRMKEKVLNRIEMEDDPHDEKAHAEQRAIEEAYDTLADPDRRARYDAELGIDREDHTSAAHLEAAVRADDAAISDPSVTANPATVTPVADESTVLADRPPVFQVPADIPDDVEIDGPFLRKIREGRGVDLKTVANVTRIGTAFLEDLEEERFDKLPALVYVRGFLSSYARYLHIDPKRATHHYVKRLQQFLASNGRSFR